MSLDGRISLNRSVSTALSGPAALCRVHELRHEYDAILIGANTALVDNPNLTDRSGKPRRRQLVRVVLDNNLRLPAEHNLVATASQFPTLIYTSNIDPSKTLPRTELGAKIIPITGGPRNLSEVLQDLYRRDIQSILVEGGSEVAGAFVDGKLVDKVTLIVSPVIVGGKMAPVAVGGNGVSSLDNALRLQEVTVGELGDDIEITGYPSFN
jgi:diaminohydroxyphosphoribosylaminopyrimidine deaminase/5-amino-6-(5-phosphoribosylamino)uracil reductase